MTDLEEKLTKTKESGGGRRRFPIRQIIPSAMTLLALCLGLTALRLGLDGYFDLAVFCIVAAGFIDGLDGTMARLLKAETALGAHLDSLSDFVNFGIVPGFVVYLWALQSTGRLGWAVILIFSVCCALRLARYNVDMEEPDRPDWKSRFFLGVPSPVAAGLMMWPIYLHIGDIMSLQENTLIVMANVVAVAFLMIFRVPTFSVKSSSTTIRRSYVLPTMILIGVWGIMLLTFPWITLTMMCILYYALIPISALIPSCDAQTVPLMPSGATSIVPRMSAASHVFCKSRCRPTGSDR